jgi:hypothetical protein
VSGHCRHNGPFERLAGRPNKGRYGKYPFLRELVIPYGSAGYVALFEIENREFVTVLAVRHQREEDYH